MFPVAAAVGLTGISARDLTPDERFFAKLGPSAIESAALDPNAFVGHMPLSYLARWAVQALMGDADPASYRLHAAFGAAFGAAITAGVVARRAGLRWGTVAGLLVALSPLVGFHARESSDYALSVLLGAVALEGALRIAEGRRRGTLLLGVALLLGLHNSLFFGFTALGLLVAAASPTAEKTGRVGRLGAAFAAALPAGILVGIQAAILRARAAGGRGDVVSGHAEPAGDAAYHVLATAWQVLKEYSACSFNGYEARVSQNPWVVAPALALVCLPVVLALLLPANPTHRRLGWAWLATVVGFVLVRVLFVHATDRAFTTGARVFTGLAPCLAALGALGAARLGPRVGPVLAATLVLGTAAATVRQVGHVSTRDRDIVATIAALHREGDLVFAPRSVLDRLPAYLKTAARRCPQTLPDAERVWVARLVDPDPPLHLDACGGGSWKGDALPYRVAWLDHFHPPPYELHSNSYLQSHVLVLLERAAAGRDPPGHPAGAVRLVGAGGGARVAVYLQPAWPRQGPELKRLDAPGRGAAERAWGPGDQGAARVEVHRAWLLSLADRLPEGLARIARTPWVALGPRAVVSSSVEPEWRRTLPWGADPALRLEGVSLRAVAAAGFAAGLLVRAASRIRAGRGVG